MTTSNSSAVAFGALASGPSPSVKNMLIAPVNPTAR